MKFIPLMLAALAVGISLVLGSSPAFATDGATAASLAPLAGLAGTVAAASVPRLRGIVSARADGADVASTLAELNRAFAAFREKNDERLAELERGRADVVTAEHVERINATVSELTATVNAQREEMDALRVGPSGNGAPATAEARAHRDAFNSWFRRGTNENALRDLEVQAGLTTQSDPDGGYLVPEEMDTVITRVLGTVSAMRSLARVITLSGNEYSVLVSQGGAASGWVGEEDSRPATANPTLSKITLNAGEIYANPAATQRMLDDGVIDIAAWLADEVAIQFAEQEGAAFISGDGIDKPKGFLKETTVANASYAWGKIGFTVTGGAASFASSNPADAIIQLFYSLKQGYRNGASFLTSDATMGTVRQMKDGQGNYLWAPPTVNGPDTILGKPVATDDNMPALAANAFPMAFGNWQRGYAIADRLGTRVLRDPFTNKPNVQFYTTKRVAGAVTNFEAIKLLKCST